MMLAYFTSTPPMNSSTLTSVYTPTFPCKSCGTRFPAEVEDRGNGWFRFIQWDHCPQCRKNETPEASDTKELRDDKLAEELRHETEEDTDSDR